MAMRSATIVVPAHRSSSLCQGASPQAIQPGWFGVGSTIGSKESVRTMNRGSGVQTPTGKPWQQLAHRTMTSASWAAYTFCWPG